MSTGSMWWGSSWINSNAPDLTWVMGVGTNTNLAKVSGKIHGPGCGVRCGRKVRRVWYEADFYLQTNRMPEIGCVFKSKPVALFSGSRTVRGTTGSGSTLDDPDAKFSFRLRQDIYEDNIRIGRADRRFKRRVNISGEEDEEEEYTFPQTVNFSEYTWTIDRTKLLHIALGIRFTLNVEGTGEIEFLNPFTFKAPMWNIISEFPYTEYD